MSLELFFKRTRLLLFVAMFAFIIVFGAVGYLFTTYKSHHALCELITTKIDKIKDPIARELILGQTESAASIFGNFKSGLTNFVQKEALTLEIARTRFGTAHAEACEVSAFRIVIDTPIFFGGNELATIRGEASYFSFVSLLEVLLIFGLILFLLVSLVDRFLVKRLMKSFIEPIGEISKGKTLSSELCVFDEVAAITKNFEQLNQKLIRLETDRVVAERDSKIAEIATQVAHDIRSPLLALTVIEKDLTSLPEDLRVILRSAASRISDIANNLIEKSRQVTPGADPDTAAEASVCLLSSLMEPLISEKRLQFHSQKGVEINLQLDQSSYGVFAKIQPSEFKRMLSNLVNNAVESLDGKGVVTVRLATVNNRAVISVRDNGSGIAPGLIGKLGQRGVSFGKKDGSGLGLYHARTCVESWGGIIKIDSELKKGTTVTVMLPEQKAPSWFVEKLVLENKSTVVVLDDDQSVHGVWGQRFAAEKLGDKGIELLYFSNPLDFRKWHAKLDKSRGPVVYLNDFELLGYNETGLDVIRELGLADDAVLVTSRFEESRVLEECQRLGIRMIPKGLAGFVPIEEAPPAP